MIRARAKLICIQTAARQANQSAMRTRIMAGKMSRCVSALAAWVGRRLTARPVEAAGPMPASITTRILILVSIAMLPLLSLSAFLVVHNADDNRAKQLQQFDATTHVMSLTVDAEVERQLAVAYTLRNALVSEGLDLLGFYNLAKATVADVPDVRIALYDRSGRWLTTTVTAVWLETATDRRSRDHPAGDRYKAAICLGPRKRCCLKLYHPGVCSGNQGRDRDTHPIYWVPSVPHFAHPSGKERFARRNWRGIRSRGYNYSANEK